MAKKQMGLCPLTVEKEAAELIKPSTQTPSPVLSLSTLDNDPYNEIVYCTVHVYKGREATRMDHGPESLLREALSNLLVYYHPLAGKLTRRICDGKLQLRCTGEGVPFTVAKSNLMLSSLGYLESLDFETLSLLLPHIDDDNYDREIGYHPLALQVTKFQCGGFTIGTALTHAVCDGFGVAHFIGALTELASGKSEPSVVPIWDRDRLVGVPDDQPAKIPGSDNSNLLAISPYMPSEDLVSVTINVKADTVKRLKGALMEGCDMEKENFTTFEVLGAYMWRSRTRALKLNPDGAVVFGLAVAIRRDMDPPLPDGYYGNACIDMHVELTAREVNESPISEIARLIREAKRKAHDGEYIREELGNREKLMEIKEWFGERDDGLMFLTDWRNIGWFGSLDFGWEEPVNLLPVVPPEKAVDLAMLLKPSTLDPSMEGGVTMVMTLPRDAVPNFKEEIEALNKLGDGAYGA